MHQPKCDLVVFEAFLIPSTKFFFYENLSSNQTHLQYGHFLAVTKEAEGKGVFVIEAGADLTASEGQWSYVAFQVIPVLVKEQLVVLEAAPALPPAVIRENIQVACQSKHSQEDTILKSRYSGNIFSGLSSWETF